ncbi:heterokaryon incompatibility protein-domain-containing protein [Aspergillus carlsbadensis]|nr:heterokaryon incompatibility protein-domain-containing protein [Aspergillus carlsbadensis]
MATTGMQETQVRPSPSALCDRCKVLEFNDKELGGLVLTSPQVGRYMSFRGMSSPIILPFNLHDTFPDLAILAASQCPLCSIVRSRIRKFRDIEWPSITELRITGISLQYNAHMRGPGPQLDFNAVGVIFGLGDEAEKLDYLLEFAIQAEHTDPCASWLRIRRRPVTSDPLSTDGVARMRQLLSTSAAEVDCDGEGAYLPTRLIDVGHNQRDPRLILSKNNPTCITGHSSRDARYAALSYCWGSPAEARSQLKTTQDTLNAHLNKIALPSLPQTVWDAVMVCRELEIQFLWVDALCIIQGDAEDWERESMEMANVYSNAFITIGALQGDSCNNWRLIVEYYSSRSLTYFADVLPAISAIARRSTHKCRGKYLAGLWSDDLQYELLWTKAEAPTSSQWSQADYTAPSWSWASCPGSVQFAENIDMLYPDFELLSAETTTNLDPFGRVSGGHISLLTKVCEIPASKLVGTELQTLSGEYLADVWFDYNSAPFPTSGQQGSHDGYLKPGILMARISTAMAPRHMTGGEDGAVVRGLLVVATGRDGEYRRIGIFYSEGIDLGGRKFWDCIDPALLRIV